MTHREARLLSDLWFKAEGVPGAAFAASVRPTLRAAFAMPIDGNGAIDAALAMLAPSPPPSGMAKPLEFARGSSVQGFLVR